MSPHSIPECEHQRDQVQAELERVEHQRDQAQANLEALQLRHKELLECVIDMTESMVGPWAVRKIALLRVRAVLVSWGLQ